MKTIEREDWKEEIELLMRLGYKREEATLIIYFIGKEEGKLKEIGQAMSLRYPDVLIGTKTLANDGILTRKIIPKKGKGRREYLYRALSKKEIFTIIKRRALLGIKKKAGKSETTEANYHF